MARFSLGKCISSVLKHRDDVRAIASGRPLGMGTVQTHSLEEKSNQWPC